MCENEVARSEPVRSSEMVAAASEYLLNREAVSRLGDAWLAAYNKRKEGEEEG